MRCCIHGGHHVSLHLEYNDTTWQVKATAKRWVCSACSVSLLVFAKQQSNRDYNQSWLIFSPVWGQLIQCAGVSNGQVSFKGAWEHTDTYTKGLRVLRSVRIMQLWVCFQCELMLMSPEWWNPWRNMWPVSVMGIRGGQKQERKPENWSERDVRGGIEDRGQKFVECFCSQSLPDKGWVWEECDPEKTG